MRIALIDDEEAVRSNLNRMLTDWADTHCLDISCDFFSNGTDFLNMVCHTQYDLLFMDIYMKELNGIETASQLRLIRPDCCLIFLTVSQEHMSEAFLCHAFDYLTKPLEEERLAQTLSDFLRIFPEKQPYLNLSLGKQTIPILYSQLEYIYTDSNYCVIQAQETYRCRISFHKLCTSLGQDERFCTINRGILVNLDFVYDMENLTCWMKSGISFPINTKKKSELKQQLINYRFHIRRKRLARRELR